MEGEQRHVRDSIVPKCSPGAESKEEGEKPRMSRIRVRASRARNDPRRRCRELRANEYETRESALRLGGEQEV